MSSKHKLSFLADSNHNTDTPTCALGRRLQCRASGICLRHRALTTLPNGTSVYFA